MYTQLISRCISSLLVALSLSGCCAHKSSHTHNDVYYIDSTTEFGNTLLTDARRISGNQNIRVFSNCKELDMLKSNKQNKLTSWGYNLSVEEAQRVNLENLQLNSNH